VKHGQRLVSSRHVHREHAAGFTHLPPSWIQAAPFGLNSRSHVERGQRPCVMSSDCVAAIWGMTRIVTLAMGSAFASVVSHV
jgi:hypothetical protein